MNVTFDDLVPQQGQTPQAVKGGIFDDLIPQQGQQEQPSQMQDIGRSAVSGAAKVGTMLMNPIGAVRDAGNYMVGNALTGAGAAYQGMGGDISPGVARFMRNPMGDMSQDPNSILFNKALPAAVQAETGMNMNYQPQTGMGRAMQTGIESLPMVAGSGGSAITPVLRAIGIGAGSEGGQQIAQAMGTGERGQQVGQFLGGGAGAMMPEGLNAVADNAKATAGDITYARQPIPASGDLRAKASENYKAGGQQGEATFSPQVTNDFLDTASQGVLPKAQRVADLASDTPSMKELNNLQSWRDTPMSVQEMLDLDKRLGNLADNEYDPITRRMSPEGANLLNMQQVLRDKTQNASLEDMQQQKIPTKNDLNSATSELQSLKALEQNLISSVQSKSQLAGRQRGFWRARSQTAAAQEATSLANVRQQIAAQEKTVNDMQNTINNAPNIAQQAIQGKQAVNSITQGRKLSAAAFKMNDIERIQQNASNALNPQTALKQGFRSLANNPARLRGYSVPEIAAINKAAKDGVITGALKVIASPLLDTIAGAAGGGAGGGIAGAYLSKIPKSMIESRQNARAENVKRLIANRPEVRSAFP